jgi:hypothetical protein
MYLTPIEAVRQNSREIAALQPGTEMMANKTIARLSDRDRYKKSWL